MADKVTAVEVDLSDKQIKFCEEYVIDWNGKRAALAAGYADVSAHVSAYENLKKEKVIAHINFLKQKTAELAGVSALRNAIELGKIAYASTADLQSDWSDVKRWDDLKPEQKTCISEITVTKRLNGNILEESVKFKLHDKLKAIDMLNKMFGFNAAEQKEINLKTSVIDWTD